MDGWNALFGNGAGFGWQQECARAVLIFVYGLVVVRLAGRRVFGRWSALDIVISIVIGSSLSRALTGNAPLAGTLAATSLMMLLHWVLARGAARWSHMSRLVEGVSIELGRDGRTDAGALRREAVSWADLREALRQAGIEQVAESRLLVLEPSGKISVLR